MMLKTLRLLTAVGATALSACQGTATVAPPATVHFVFAVTLCSSIVPFKFTIDGQPLGVDTFRTFTSAEGPKHITSRDFVVAPGEHTFSARPSSGVGWPWPDTTATLFAGDVLADSLRGSCS